MRLAARLRIKIAANVLNLSRSERRIHPRIERYQWLDAHWTSPVSFAGAAAVGGGKKTEFRHMLPDRFQGLLTL
jgi:hypothetical protein